MFKLNKLSKSVSIFLLSALTTASLADESYKTIANTLSVAKDSTVTMKLQQLSEDDDVACVGDDKTIFFRIEEEYPATSKWLDLIILARSSQQLLNFEFDAADCMLTGITYPELFIDNTGTDPVTTSLQTTGDHGNVALIGTNDLTQASIKASAYHSSYKPAGAFDGHIYLAKINEDAGEQIDRGLWLTKIKADDGKSFIKPWISIDFGKKVELGSMAIVVNDKSVELGRLPKEVSILASNNGESFKEMAKLKLNKSSRNLVEFSSPIQAQHFKIKVLNGNQGDANYVEIDELEFYLP